MRPPSAICAAAILDATKTERTLIEKVSSKTSIVRVSSEPVGKIPALFPKCANGLLHCAFDSCGIGIIGRYCYRSMPASTDGIDDCVGPFRCARVSQRNVRTIARQSLHYGRANAAASAGHECNSAFQVRHR
jgi:hypothetical protein